MPFALPHPHIIHAMILTSMTFTTIAAANSFDCTNADTPTEKAICSDPYTLGLDSKLGQAWKMAKATVKDTAMLTADQRQWIKNRDYCATDFHCIRVSYSTRIVELQHAGKPFNWKGTWRRVPWGRFDSAEWKITGRAPKLGFTVKAATKMTSGMLTGTFNLEGSEGIYHSEDCTLILTPTTALLNVIQVGECRGTDAVFGGRYVVSEQPLDSNYDLLSLGLVRTQEEDDAARQLLKDDYQTVLDASDSIYYVDESAADNLGAQVTQIRVLGLPPPNAALLMRGRDAQLWVAVLVSDQKQNYRVRYYTNVQGWKGRLPGPIQRWYAEQFNWRKAPLDYMP
ncbi:lysozyme inhibitor LprI family protein [Pseudomonas sp. MWU13-2100]|uniref:lysozyme inhibitor LprI family protein n=1 Tax=Pseudomonas sp. MWU13-2100 TaxID=2935075 RepID=UPI00200CCEC8|nr:hypothetical protein [Pseudomonas sp. MWU13-2100]